MDLRLAVHRTAGVQDLQVGIEPAATVGQLAERLLAVDPVPDLGPDLSSDLSPDLSQGPRTAPVTLAVAAPDGWSLLAPAVPVAQSTLRSGLAVTVVRAGNGPGSATDDPVRAVLLVRSGPDAGAEFPLRAGTWTVGRGAAADIALTDPLVSRRHAQLRIGRDALLTDLNSANGIQVDGSTVAIAHPARPSGIRLGDTGLTVRMLDAGRLDDPPVVPFNRPPHVQQPFTGLHEEIADPPQRAPGQIFPVFSILLPVALGLVVWWVTHSALTALFLGLSSLLLIGAVMEQSISARRGHRRATAAFRAELAAQRQRFVAGRHAEKAARCREHPSTDDVRTAVLDRSALLWLRRPEESRFGELRLGTARLPSRSTLTLPARRGDAALLAEADRLAAEFADVDDAGQRVELA